MSKMFLAALAALLLWPEAPALAQAWPSKPIRFVISFGPGSASDAISRILAQELSPALGQPVVVIHKPGADGSLSGIEVQRSAADGYSFLFGTNSALAVAPSLRKVPPYNVLTDFTPVSLVGINTLFFVVHPSVPAKTLAELVALGRANPGKINAATGHTYAIVATGLFAKQNDLKVETIPYKSEPDAIVDLLTGRVDMMVSTSTAVYGHAREGKLRVLAGTTATRNPLWPDVPTMVEAGQPQHPFESWFALVGPAGLPADIAARMNTEVATALNKASSREQMMKHGVIARPLPLAESAKYIADQNTVWKKALQEAGVEPQ
jgi:tripartite-type tricarboxylate transporter receptor subunit TctC